MQTPFPTQGSLPIPLTSFVGRDEEIATIADLLGSRRLVTLTGAGGSGKTRLVLEVAARLGERFADGVVFVDLGPLCDPELVIPTTARALGIRDAGDQPLADRLAEYLSDKHLLLLLDNFEHLLEAAPRLPDLLRAAPHLAVLATSRASLRVRGETELMVAPLACPDPARLPDLETLAASDAVTLFVRRATAADPDFRLTAENAQTVAAICARLDGLPLALELAAARLKVLTPAALLSRLYGRPPESPLHLLTGGARDLPARQHTLRDASAWSYDLLSPAEQRLFRRLAVFVGGCRLGAAEAVGNAPGDLGSDVLDSVASLVDNSLLVRDIGPAPLAGGAQPRPAGGLEGSPPYEQEARFRMLGPVRRLVLEPLAGSEEEEAVRR